MIIPENYFNKNSPIPPPQTIFNILLENQLNVIFLLREMKLKWNSNIYVLFCEIYKKNSKHFSYLNDQNKKAISMFINLLVIRETMAWFMLIRTMLGSAMRSEVC
jgi:hypothetical protein